MELKLVVAFPPEICAQLNRIEAQLGRLTRNERVQNRILEGVIMNLQDLVDEVNADTQQDSAVVTALDRLADLIEQAAGNQAQIDSLVQQLRTNKEAVAQALLNVNPTAPPPVVEPPPPTGGENTDSGSTGDTSGGTDTGPTPGSGTGDDSIGGGTGGDTTPPPPVDDGSGSGTPPSSDQTPPPSEGGEPPTS